MRQTTLFGTTNKSVPAFTNTPNNNTHKTTKQSPLSPRNISDYFKRCATIHKQENNTQDVTVIVTDSQEDFDQNTPLKAITLGINKCSMDAFTPEVNKKVNTDTSNRITSHFLPKQLDEKSLDEDELSLNKRKPKIPDKELFLKEDQLQFENFRDVLTLSEFVLDFQDVLDITSEETWKPPDFNSIYKALQNSNSAENYREIASLLLRFMSLLLTEPFMYFDENIVAFATHNNIAAILRLYLVQKSHFHADKLKTDIYGLPFDLKVSIFNQLIDDITDSNEFRTFYEKKLALIDDLKRKLRVLQSGISHDNRDMSALKLCQTEKNQSLLNTATPVTDIDKENMQNLANKQSDDEDIDTRLHKLQGKINHSHREIAKVQTSLERLESIVFSKKKIGTDSCGREYYYLKSYSETAVLVELEESKRLFFESLTKKQPDEGVETNCNNEAASCVEIRDQTSWFEYNTESELNSLVKYLKSDKCDKKLYLQIEGIISKISSKTNEVDTPEVIETHYLRSLNKNRVFTTPFSPKEFATQLLEFGEDLLYSGLVSTKLDCLDWIDSLSSEDWHYTTGIYEELQSKLMSLMDSLIDSTKENFSKSATESLIESDTPSLSQLFLLLDYYERNIHSIDSCFGKYCKKCHKKTIWNGNKYTPLFICSGCSKSFHLYCQDPPLVDIPTSHRCNSCRTPQSLITSKFYRTRELQASEDESSSETEIVVTRKSLRYKTRVNYFNSSPELSKYEKKRRVISSSDSEDQSPYTRRRGLRSMVYQPPKKKILNRQSEYTSKLRSACC